MIDPQLPGNWKTWLANFSVTNGALAKILADVAPPVVQPVIAAETAIPGESSVRQRILTGGQRIIDGIVSSTDGTARSVCFYVGKQATLYANMGVVTITATNALNRTVGSFVTDGYKVGDICMFFGSTSAANDGIQGLLVTGVTATVLTFNGALLTNETMAAGFRVFRVALRTRKGVPLNAGNADAAPPVPFFGGTQDPSTPSQPDAGWSLGADDALIVAMAAAVSAVPATVNFSAHAVLY